MHTPSASTPRTIPNTFTANTPLARLTIHITHSNGLRSHHAYVRDANPLVLVRAPESDYRG